MNRKSDDRHAQQSFIAQKEIHTWAIHIDGASRNNPGKAGAGVVMKKDGEVVSREGFYLGIKTNNQAEYYALLLSLFFVCTSIGNSPSAAIRIISGSHSI